MIDNSIYEQRDWKGYERILFRFLFAYFLLQIVPVDWKFYERLSQINWLQLGLADLFNISRYTRQIVETPTSADFWGIHTFADWGVMAVIAFIVAAVWSFVDKRKEYDRLYYILRVIVRYRLAIGVIAYGFLKLFPLQSPYPALSTLNTNYGDLSAWKIFSLSLGIAPSFEVFLGSVEILAGLLLLNRKTVFLASFIILCFTGNVFLSNLAYEGGETVYSLYLIQLALFLLWYDAPRLFTLLSLEKPAHPNKFKWVYTKRQYQVRLLLKGLFVFTFVIFYGAKAYSVYRQGGYQYPLAKGPLQEGFYEVTHFVYNGDSIAFSNSNRLRWQNVVIEKWPTLSIKTGKYSASHSSNVEIIHTADTARDYEYSGTTARQYYRYQLDTNTHKLVLKTLNDKREPDLSFTFNRRDDRTITLTGRNTTGDSLYVVLQQVDKKYLLEEAKKAGRRSRLVL